MKRKARYHLAVVGATGAVGEELLRVLKRRNFPIASLKLLASVRSAGKKILFDGQDCVVEELSTHSFEGMDIALFSAGGERSKQFAPIAVKAGCVVVDNSSAFRMDPEVPLVVPEINPGDVKQHRGIIANPNCTTIIAGVVLWPLHRAAKIKRAVICTYQAVSGAGAQAMQELSDQSRAYLSGQSLSPEIFKHPIAFNLFSHDSAIGDHGYSQEEMKVVNETRKIFHDDSLHISPTCVRVPVFRAHAEAIHLEFKRPLEEQEARALLAKAPGVTVIDEREANTFPMPMQASHQDDVFVGRIRQDIDLDNGLNLLVCGDQILKGAALNAVQIAELLIT